MNNFMNLKSVEWAIWAGLLLLGLASILLVTGAAFRLAPGSMSESNASTLPGSIANSTELLREKTELSVQVMPVLDHSVVNREGILAEPEPSSPMSSAYYHV